MLAGGAVVGFGLLEVFSKTDAVGAELAFAFEGLVREDGLGDGFGDGREPDVRDALLLLALWPEVRR